MSWAVFGSVVLAVDSVFGYRMLLTVFSGIGCRVS